MASEGISVLTEELLKTQNKLLAAKSDLKKVEEDRATMLSLVNQVLSEADGLRIGVDGFNDTFGRMEAYKLWIWIMRPIKKSLQI